MCVRPTTGNARESGCAFAMRIFRKHDNIPVRRSFREISSGVNRGMSESTYVAGAQPPGATRKHFESQASERTEFKCTFEIKRNLSSNYPMVRLIADQNPYDTGSPRASRS